MLEIMLIVLLLHMHFAPVQCTSISAGQHVFDLSYSLYEEMPIRDAGLPPEISLVEQDEGHGVRSEHYDFCISEKLGTHINAPSTYERNKNNNISHFNSVDTIPLRFLVNVPGIVVDPRKVLNSKEVILTRSDLEDWEQNHGRIPHGAFVILRSGWGKYYDFRDKFFGYFADENQQVFPEFALEAVKWLVEHRQIVGIGTEGPEVELSQRGQVKLYLAQKRHYSVVQLANVDLLPYRGFSITVAPLKLQNGTGGPTRVFAAIDRKKQQHHSELKKVESVYDHQRKDEEYCENYIKYKRQPQVAFESAEYPSGAPTNQPIKYIILLASLVYIITQ